ncbi:MAG: hypothetical protein IPH20_24985 [Bacteroidales bacterium]|nr:hypothetical protein [Bacteroidales bacterium]
MSRLFVLTGIQSPGKVNLRTHGTVNLEDISDELAIELFKAGCPFLYPTKEYFAVLYPDGFPICVSELKESKITVINKSEGPSDKGKRAKKRKA